MTQNAAVDERIFMWYIIPKEMADVICHHGIKGQKWGVRKGPPYPLEEKGNHKETLRLPVKEYAHVMSEIATHATEAQKAQKMFIKNIGKHAYLVENNFDGTYRIVDKRKIE